MSTIGGLATLLVGATIMIVGISALVWRERRHRRPKHTVAHYERSRHAMRDIFKTQMARRASSHEKARKDHPSSKHKRGRKSA